jgi:hypothetical protein
MSRRKLVIIGVFLCVCLSACGTASNSTTPGYTTISAGTLTPNDSIAAPSGPIVLSLSGKIGVTNTANRLDLDMETLEQLGVVEFTVGDPYLKRPVTYQGVLLKRLLEVARVAQDATTLHTIALNDYATDVPIEPVNTWPVMLATKRDGQRMPVSDKGPIEIVFPYNTFPIDPVVYDPMWVWQLRSIEVR